VPLIMKCNGSSRFDWSDRRYWSNGSSRINWSDRSYCL